MVVAPFKAAGTSGILILTGIPAAVRYIECTRNNQKHSAALCPETGFQYHKLRRTTWILRKGIFHVYHTLFTHTLG